VMFMGLETLILLQVTRLNKLFTPTTNWVSSRETDIWGEPNYGSM